MPRNISGNQAYKPKRPFKTVEGLGTEPWMRLSRNAAFVLDRFYAKFNGFNRSNLSLTYEEIKNKMSNRLFSFAIWELVGFGFIDILKAGGLKREKTVYGFSNRWRKLLDAPEKLDKIDALLREMKILMREQGSVKKRMQIRELKNEIPKVSIRKSQISQYNKLG